MTTFRHSGRMGDIVWSLAFVKQIGGGVFYLNSNSPYGFTPVDLEFIKPLLEKQPYIERVEVWNGQQVDYDLDAFRSVQNSSWHGTTAEGFFKARGMDMGIHNHIEPWLYTEPVKNNKIILSRSKQLYHRPEQNPFWMDLLKKNLQSNCVFVGTREEGEIFNRVHECNIEYYPVKDALELANLISGSSMWTGNQALQACIAEAVKVTTFLEVRNDNAWKDHVFNRANLILV